MTHRRVRFTATAREHANRERAWWLANRSHGETFAADLEAGLRVIAFLPGTGTLYSKASIVGLRRIYLSRIACHLYYTFDPDEIIVRALWGARRRGGPALQP